MRSATFPPIRVEPEVRAEVEAVLLEGESLTQFIEGERIIPFGGTGYIVLFDTVGEQVVVGAVRHQREDDFRH